jgi:uncharacterized protein with ATP-grasp and redox domains
LLIALRTCSITCTTIDQRDFRITCSTDFCSWKSRCQICHLKSAKKQLEILTSASEVLSAIFENPAQLIFALGNLGADISEEREEATKTIVAATIVGNIATTTAMVILGGVGYRRPN